MGEGLEPLISPGDWHEQEYKTWCSKADSACKIRHSRGVMGTYGIWKLSLPSYLVENEACIKETLAPNMQASSFWCNWGTKGGVILHWTHRNLLTPGDGCLLSQYKKYSFSDECSHWSPLHISPNFSWWGVSITIGTLGSHFCPIRILRLLTKSQHRTIPSIIGCSSFYRNIPSGRSLPALFQTCPNVFSCGCQCSNTLTFQSGNMELNELP